MVKQMKRKSRVEVEKALRIKNSLKKAEQGEK